MLGENLLVAPIVEKGRVESEIYLPTGTWIGFDSKEYTGGRKIRISTPLNTLPYFYKK